MKLSKINTIEGMILVLSGLHIGAGDTEMRIGGTDHPVIKDPISGQPYIPGSSLKGKIRSLLEWRYGLVSASGGNPVSFKHINDSPDQSACINIIKLFGGAPDNNDKGVKDIGPTRLAFWDCQLNHQWKEIVDKKNLLTIEAKSENTIDRIKGTASNPRFTERVIAGAQFDFKLSLKVLNENEDLLNIVLQGLKLLENDSLGGSGSRGYGKIKFANLRCGGAEIQEKFDKINPFE